MHPDEAAEAIAKAIIERPRTNEPPWVWPAELASVLLAGPADRAARLWHRRYFAELWPHARGTAAMTTGDVASTAARALVHSGLLGPPTPVAVLRLVREIYRGGTNLYTLLAVSAARWPDRTAMIDDDGALSYRELQAKTESLASSSTATVLGPARRWGSCAATGATSRQRSSRPPWWVPTSCW